MGTTDAPLALGLDIGGTSTRALVIDGAGRRLGSGRADGANLTSHAPEKAFDAVSAAVAAALATVDPATVGAAVIASAGDNNLVQPSIASVLAERWATAGLTCGYSVVADAVAAFVAGTPAPDGTLVLSGTGALAARFADRRPAQIIDAHGWLLGDFGSGFFLGRSAVQATLAALDRHTRPGPLGLAVLETLTGVRALDPGFDPGFDPAARHVSADLVLAVHAKPPVALAALAPLVTAHAGVDPAADRILAEAAGHLLEETAEVRSSGDTTPIVLAGSLLTADTPLSRLVRTGLASRWPSAVVGVALDGAAGAAWLAARSLYPADADRLHEALFA